VRCVDPPRNDPRINLGNRARLCRAPPARRADSSLAIPPGNRILHAQSLPPASPRV